MPWRVDEQEPGDPNLEAKLLKQVAANLFDRFLGQKACANPLRYLAGFAFCNGRTPQLIQERGLAMIHMSEYDHDWLAYWQCANPASVGFLQCTPSFPLSFH